MLLHSWKILIKKDIIQTVLHLEAQLAPSGFGLGSGWSGEGREGGMSSGTGTGTGCCVALPLWSGSDNGPRSQHKHRLTDSGSQNALYTISSCCQQQLIPSSHHNPDVCPFIRLQQLSTIWGLLFARWTFCSRALSSCTQARNRDAGVKRSRLGWFLGAAESWATAPETSVCRL